MKQHTYIIPYYIKNNEILILLARKKFYSSKDGFIHSNPNQYVLIGGHLEKEYKSNVIFNIQKEFEEETGHRINTSNIKLLDTKNNNFFVGTYQCNDNEYNKFKNLKLLNTKFKELDDVIWVNVKDSIDIMNKYNKLNINYMTQEYLDVFYNNIYREDNQWFPTKEIIEVIKKYQKPNMSNKKVLINYIFPLMYEDDRNIYNLLFSSVNKYIKKNSYYDWFIDSVNIFIKNTSLNISPKKSPKKSEVKKRYVPPHLRNKN